MTDHGTAIGWTHIPGYKGETWNPVTGCDRVSPGCAHCYALELAGRLKRMGQPRYQRDGDPKSSGPGFGVTLHSDKLDEPLRWTKPRAVFVNSMSDLFHEAIPDEFIADVFAVMACAPRHLFLVLTKRPERMRDLLASDRFLHRVAKAVDPDLGFGWPLANCWAGVTIENRRFVHRADLLRETPAAVRFISAEPLLGPLVARERHATNAVWNRWVWDDDYTGPDLDLRGIDWLIVGGESGPGHRRIDPQWVSHLNLRCRMERDSTAFFFKQWGGPKPTSNGRLIDGREYSEFPAVAT